MFSYTCLNISCKTNDNQVNEATIFRRTLVLTAVPASRCVVVPPPGGALFVPMGDSGGWLNLGSDWLEEERVWPPWWETGLVW